MALSRQVQAVSEARDAARKIWDAVNTLAELRKEWDAGLGNDLPSNFPIEDFGVNYEVNKDQIGAVVFDTAQAIDAALTSGHLANLRVIL